MDRSERFVRLSVTPTLLGAAGAIGMAGSVNLAHVTTSIQLILSTSRDGLGRYVW